MCGSQTSLDRLVSVSEAEIHKYLRPPPERVGIQSDSHAANDNLNTQVSVYIPLSPLPVLLIYCNCISVCYLENENSHYLDNKV